jgi:pimeloyl-ACP methyl ester carboxylesterase
MPKVKRLTKSFLRLLLPVAVLILVATVGASVWLVHETSHPINTGYLVTPEKYGMLSSRGAQVTEETWQSKDGQAQKGWLLRGEPNMPAVILLHKYGANRSHVLNLGVKLNEATNFTVLMPDLRGHGTEASEQKCTFGGCESDDLTATVDYVKGLKTADGQFQLIGGGVGIYGLEMGALSALATANHPDVKAVALDSIPADSDAVLSSAIGTRFPFASTVTEKLGQMGTYAYFYDGCYKRGSACEMAKLVQDRNVLLLAGADARSFQESTSKLSKCFPNSVKMDSKTDLSPSGMNILNASLEISGAYDQRIIDFFRNSFAPPVQVAVQ